MIRLLPLVAFALGGCATTPDVCITLCQHAEATFTACLADEGQDWGPSVGFTSERDFDDWCSTWVWEEQQLSDDPSGECAQRQALVDDGTCSDWYGAWGDDE